MKKEFLKQRSSSAQPLNDIISHVLKAQNLEVPLNDKRAEEAWKNVAGTAFMKYTTSVRSDKGVLYLSLSSSIVRKELSMAKSFIIKNLNQHLGSNVVKDIIFR